MSTPVIDTASGTIYVVAQTKNTVNSTYHYYLHALDILSGAEKFGGPVEISGQVAGTGAGSDIVTGTVSFNPLQHLNRPGLLLMNGVVYVAFGSIGDTPPYHGWLFGYNAGALQQAPAVYCDTPNGSAGAIWQGGQGLLGDTTGNIYFMSGNGTFDANVGGADYGDSIVKLNYSPTPGLTVTVTLPSGVTLKTGAGGSVSSGVITITGVAAPGTSVAVYTPASGGNPGTVALVMASTATAGFGPGEFATITCDLATGLIPKATDFPLSNFGAIDLRGAPVNGLTASVAII